MDHFTQQCIGSFHVTCVSADSVELLDSSLESAGFEREVIADLLWQKLMDQGQNRAAVIWHNAQHLLAGHLQTLLDAVAVSYTHLTLPTILLV